MVSSVENHVRDVIDQCDIILEVVDARDIEGTRSPKLESQIRKKKKVLIIVVNKADLHRPKILPRGNVIVFSAKKRLGTHNLRTKIYSFCYKNDQTKVGVIGYANTGKSSVIQSLGGNARVSPKPGFTRGKEWLRISKNMMLLDSPGLIPREEGETSLAIKGAYDVNRIKDPEGVAMELIKRLGIEHVAKNYQVETKATDEYELLESLAEEWCMLLKKGQADTNRSSRKLIHDWQIGKLT